MTTIKHMQSNKALLTSHWGVIEMNVTKRLWKNWWPLALFIDCIADVIFENIVQGKDIGLFFDVLKKEIQNIETYYLVSNKNIL